ncbi:hypothetical protein [Deinococcus sp.]|uniref:hypothetical protein n=1 Tax=Deinococcus sp. TaxID=47478 RepID=UPI003B5C5212
MPKSPMTGLIYRQDGAFAQFSVSLILQSDGRVRYEVLGEPYSTRHFRPDPATVVHWGRICYHSLRHELFAEVGPVGKRLAYRYAAHIGSLGAKRGAAMHAALRRAGVPDGQHYAAATAALNWPVVSLAVLTPQEAAAVWRTVRAQAQAA